MPSRLWYIIKWYLHFQNRVSLGVELFSRRSWILKENIVLGTLWVLAYFPQRRFAPSCPMEVSCLYSSVSGCLCNGMSIYSGAFSSPQPGILGGVPTPTWTQSWIQLVKNLCPWWPEEGTCHPQRSHERGLFGACGKEETVKTSGSSDCDTIMLACVILCVSSMLINNNLLVVFHLNPAWIHLLLSQLSQSYGTL